MPDHGSRSVLGIYALNALFFTTLVGSFVRPWWYEWVSVGWALLIAYVVYRTLRPTEVDDFLARADSRDRGSQPNGPTNDYDAFVPEREGRTREAAYHHEAIARRAEAAQAEEEHVAERGRETWFAPPRSTGRTDSGS